MRPIYKWRFTVRALLVVVTVLCILSALVGRYVQSQEARLEAIRATEEFAVIVGPVGAYMQHFEESEPITSCLIPRRYRRSVRNITLIGLAHVSNDINGTMNYEFSMVDYDFDNLKRFPELESLEVDGDATEEQLLTISNKLLQVLKLTCPNATDRVIEHLSAHCRNLEMLQIKGGCISDASLVSLAKLERLQALAIDGSRVTPLGVRRLCRKSDLTVSISCPRGNCDK